MDYYINEYSLRGQFQNIEEFFDSLRRYTLPVLNKIHMNKENIIWKKDTFWQCEICKGISLHQIPRRKNESMALLNEGRIISFIHPSYKEERLPVLIRYQDTDSEVFIDNISDISWWENEPFAKTWRIGQKYLIEIRSNEFAYHPPHFHVSHNEFAAVFQLKDGSLYAGSHQKLNPKFIAEIREWYENNEEELWQAWNRLHS